MQTLTQKEHFLTAEGRQALEMEFGQLTQERRREIAARIQRASENGGTVDNAEYEEAKNEQAFVEGRISDLDGILSSAVVASKSSGNKGIVEFGSSVTVASQKGAKNLYRVVGSAEAAPLEGKISIESPVGQALMGHKKGDAVKVDTPSGVINLTILNIV